MKRTAMAVLSALLLTASSAISAQDAPVETIPVDRAAETPPPREMARLPYTWAAGGARHTEFDRHAVDGFGVAGSYLLMPNVYGVGALFVAETDDPNPVESTQFEVGLGYRMALNPATDLNAALRMVQQATESTRGTAEALGVQIDAGVRRMLAERLEGSGGLSFIQIDNSSHTYVTASALYSIRPDIGVGAEANFGNPSYSYGLLARWAF